MNGNHDCGCGGTCGGPNCGPNIRYFAPSGPPVVPPRSSEAAALTTLVSNTARMTMGSFFDRAHALGTETAMRQYAAKFGLTLPFATTFPRENDVAASRRGCGSSPLSGDIDCFAPELCNIRLPTIWGMSDNLVDSVPLVAYNDEMEDEDIDYRYASSLGQFDLAVRQLGLESRVRNRESGQITPVAGNVDFTNFTTDGDAHIGFELEVTVSSVHDRAPQRVRIRLGDKDNAGVVTRAPLPFASLYSDQPIDEDPVHRDIKADIHWTVGKCYLYLPTVVRAPTGQEVAKLIRCLEREVRQQGNPQPVVERSRIRVTGCNANYTWIARPLVGDSPAIRRSRTALIRTLRQTGMIP